MTWYEATSAWLRSWKKPTPETWVDMGWIDDNSGVKFFEHAQGGDEVAVHVMATGEVLGPEGFTRLYAEPKSIRFSMRGIDRDVLALMTGQPSIECEPTPIYDALLAEQQTTMAHTAEQYTDEQALEAFKRRLDRLADEVSQKTGEDYVTTSGYHVTHGPKNSLPCGCGARGPCYDHR
jgi:hypothetical protein